MRAVLSVCTLLIGVAIILTGNGLLGTLLGVRGEMEGFSSTVMGLIMGGYFAGFMLGPFLLPPLIRRIGHIRAFAALASIASVVTLAHGLMVWPWVWFGLRLVAGTCMVGIYIVIESWLNSRTANDHRGQVFSIYMTVTLLGLGVGQLLLLTGEVAGLELFALASVLLSLGLVPVALTRVEQPQLRPATRLGLRQLYRISPLGVVGCVFAGLGAGAFWGLGPVFVVAIGLGTAGVAGFMGLTIAGGILMLWPVGRLSDRIPRRHVLIWVCLLSSLAATGAYWAALHVPVWVFGGGLAYGAFAFSIYALSAAHTNDHVDGAQMLEVSSGLQLLWGAGAMVGPVLAGVLMQHTAPGALLLFMAAAALVPGLFARWRMAVRPSIPLHRQSEFVGQFVTSPEALELIPERSSPDQDSTRHSGHDAQALGDGR